MGRIDDRLAELGLELPPPVKLPAGTRMAFRPAQRAGNLLYLSGNGPIVNGVPVVTGKVGAEVSVEQAYQAARITTLNLLAAARNELGTWTGSPNGSRRSAWSTARPVSRSSRRCSTASPT